MTITNMVTIRLEISYRDLTVLYSVFAGLARGPVAGSSSCTARMDLIFMRISDGNGVLASTYLSMRGIDFIDPHSVCAL